MIQRIRQSTSQTTRQASHSLRNTAKPFASQKPSVRNNFVSRNSLSGSRVYASSLSGSRVYASSLSGSKVYASSLLESKVLQKPCVNPAKNSGSQSTMNFLLFKRTKLLTLSFSFKDSADSKKPRAFSTSITRVNRFHSKVLPTKQLVNRVCPHPSLTFGLTANARYL